MENNLENKLKAFARDIAEAVLWELDKTSDLRPIMRHLSGSITQLREAIEDEIDLRVTTAVVAHGNIEHRG